MCERERACMSVCVSILGRVTVLDGKFVCVNIVCFDVSCFQVSRKCMRLELVNF